MAQHFKNSNPSENIGGQGAAGGAPSPCQQGSPDPRSHRPQQRRRSPWRVVGIIAAVLVVAGIGVACALMLPGLVSGGQQGGAATEQTDSPAGADGAQTGEGNELTEEELLAQQVDEKVGGMTLEQKFAQMFFVKPESLTGVGQVVAAGDATKEALEKIPVGGIIYFAENLEDPDQTREMLTATQSYAQEISGLPIFLGVDEEGGTVSRVGGNEAFGIENVGNMADVGATGDTEQAYDVAVEIGTYLTDLGFNVDFAPDADIANNPESDTMSLRAFGATADAVSPMVEAQVKGFADAGILCSAKHFPGIGGAEGDSHDTKIYSEKTADEMAEEELKPFEAAIEAGVPFVMVGHLSAPNITGDDDPSSISSEIVTDLLRDRLGYEGIAITDSMAMGAATSTTDSGQLAVEAIKAGIDVVLMPEDLEAAYQAVLDAVNSGEITEDRIDESVRRIVTVKLDRLADTEE